MRFISYAQNFEDVMLWRALSDVPHGFYIDVGAADPVDLNVTQAFYQRGWRGVNVEPARHYFGRLEAARVGDINLNVVLGTTPGVRVFYEVAKSGLSTLDGDIAATHDAAGWSVQRREVEATTLAALCEQYAPPDIHFLKIDVEGAEGEVLAGANLQTFRPWIVLLEATRPMTTEGAADWEPIILAADYVFVWFDGLNRFYVAKEHHPRLKPHFELPPNYFDNFDKYDFELQTWRAEQQAQQQALQATERHLEGRLNEVKLLEEERRLRQRRQYQLAAEVARLRQAYNDASQNLAETERKLDEAQEACAQSRQWLHDADQGRHHWEVLNRLAQELRWDQGPRALRLVLPLARIARRLRTTGQRHPVSAHRDENAARAPSPIGNMQTPVLREVDPPVPTAAIPQVLCGAPSHGAVHQFHPGSSYGDAVTNSMLLTQRILRGLGYRSEIYVEHRDPALADRLLMLDDLPMHADYVLIVLHSLGYQRTERIAALPAPKILMYHNITPASFLRGIPELARLAELGRAELDFWRPRVTAALTVSHYNAIELRQHGYEGVGICPILFDVDELRARFKPRRHNADDPFTVLFVGRIVENKGQADLIDAFDAFRRLYEQPCQLVLVGRFEGGGDDYLEEVFERITGHGLRQMVRLTGQVSDEELVTWYNRADLYVSLSQHEGFGVPLIEAMAHDLPVVAYAAGAVPFTMNAHRRDASTILYSRDPAAVAEAMMAIATDASLRSEVIRENRKNLNRFKLQHHVPVLLQALLKAGARRPAEPDITRELTPHLHFTVTGHFDGTYSLAAANRALAFALERANPSRVRIEAVESEQRLNLSGVPIADALKMQRLAVASTPEAGLSVTISQHYPVHVPRAATPTPDLLAAYFFWEESLVPAATVALLNRCFDAVFAPSRFVAKVLIDSGVCIPVCNVGYAPALATFARLGETKRRVRGRDDPIVFLHVSSAFPRKGVDVLLNAFASAFAGGGRTRLVRLVIKAFPNPHNNAAAQIARLQDLQVNLPEIVLIERDIGEDELLALYLDADVMVLPTRGEGFNMPAAEAAVAGLPLIVTGAGGHADFLDARDAVLLPWQVRYSRSHLNTGLSLWFEPDETALADAMLAVFKDLTTGGGQTAARAATARQAVLPRLDPLTWAVRVANAAANILLSQRPRPIRFAWMSSWDVRCGVAEYTRHYVSEFELMATPEDRLLMLCDDRTPLQHAGRLKVVPAWHGNVQDVDRLASIINREDPDVLMIQHQPGLIGWSSLVTLLNDPRLRPRIVVVTLHTTLQLLDLAAAESTVVLASLRQVARVIVHTPADVNLLTGLDFLDNVVMIPQGVAAGPGAASPARPLTATDMPVIGCYGFLLPPKGLPQLIAAFAALKESWPKMRLRMVNALYPVFESTVELESCQALAERLGVSSSIDWFTDFLPHEQSMSLLGGCDLIVLPYALTKESSSAALRSCLASGAPVAVSSIAIFDEAEEAVCRVDAENSAELANSISLLLSDSAARQKLQDAAARWIIPRAWNVIARQVHGMVSGLAVNAALEENDEAGVTPANFGSPRDSGETVQESEHAA